MDPSVKSANPATLYCLDRSHINMTLGGHGFRIVRITTDVLLVASVLVLNILLVAAIVLYRRRHRGSAELYNSSASIKFVLLLAVSDVLVGLSVPVYLLPHYWCDLNDVIRKTQSLCIFKFFSTCFTAVLSNTSLIAVAADRYIAVVHTLRYRLIMTTRVCYIALTVVLAFSFLSSSVLFVWNYWTPCTYCDLEDVMPHVYVMLLGTVCHVGILVVVFVTHYQLHLQARQSASRRDILELSCGSARPAVSSNSTSKSARVVFLVTGVYFLCWTPYSICLMVRIMRRSSPYSPAADFAFQFTFPFSLANSALNPFIYAWKNSEIRSAVVWFLRTKRTEKV